MVTICGPGVYAYVPIGVRSGFATERRTVHGRYAAAVPGGRDQRWRTYTSVGSAISKASST